MILRPARWIALATTFATALAGPALGQSAPRAKTPASAGKTAANDRATLLAHEDGWAKALTRRDRAYFETMLAPAFVYTEDDRLMTRAAVLTDLLTGTDTVTRAHNEDMVVHLFGATAVVTGILDVGGRGKGGPFTHRYRFTDTWSRQPDGSWKIVAAQDYLIPAKR